jgi:hypothetical protein
MARKYKGIFIFIPPKRAEFAQSTKEPPNSANGRLYDVNFVKLDRAAHAKDGILGIRL